jgi:hypothetical protein
VMVGGEAVAARLPRLGFRRNAGRAKPLGVRGSSGGG